MSAKNALYNYLDKEIKKQERLQNKGRTNKKTNARPEKEVEKSVMKWLGQNGFSCHVIESKANFSPSAGRFLRGPTISGMPDIIGCDSNGVGAFIELKAPGRRSTLRSAQKDFLLEKIKLGCFAMVCDSVYSLADCYEKWGRLVRAERIKFLLNMLPKARKSRNAGDRKRSDFLD